MPSKAEFYRQMAEQVSTRLVGSWKEWTAFLTTAARLYKYPFHEQMMIYAQRPDATACAEYDLWNEKMGRYVRRGSKGIALVDDSENIFNMLQERGRMPYCDSTPAPIIKQKFGISKAAFKRALGRLMKEGKVYQEDGWTILK